MQNVSGFKCCECAGEHRVEDIEYACPSCGGNLDLIYDYPSIARTLSRRSLASTSEQSMWRYRALLPVEAATPTPPLAVGWTSVSQSLSLARRLGLAAVWIKDEGRNPTG